MEKANLPEEVIAEILSRLPVKSLLRFRCVSKSWLSLISNPHFAKLHFQRSSQHSHRILHMVDSKARSLDFNASLQDDSAIVRLNFPLRKSLDDVHIMGSCRGFLLLVLDNYSKLFIWNPSNGIFKQIPPSSLQNYIFLYGFAYDEFADDYLLVLASCDPNAYDSVTEVEIFSLRTNYWKKLDGNYQYISRMEDPEPLSGSFLNGAIHWLASRLEGQLSNEVIIAFDLMEKNFREVPMPDDFKYGSCDLKVLGGCLSLIDENGFDAIVIWMMKEYEVKSSWTMHITLSLVDIPTHYISPICFTKDSQIVGMDGCLGLVKCNDKGVPLEHRQYCHDPQRCRGTASVYSETLLSPPGDQGSSANQPSGSSP